MSLQIVREFTAVAPGQWFVETTARAPRAPGQQKPAVAPAPSATSEDLRRAFADFLAVMPDEQQKVVVAEVRARRPKAGHTKFEDTPETRAAARELFGF